VEPVLHTEVTFPMQGVRDWRNPSNGARIVEIHYTADPKKRSQKWQQEMRSQLDPMGVKREYEIDWGILKGKPVYEEDWSDDLHRLREPFVVEQGVPLVAGWDFQKFPSMVLNQWTSGKANKVFPYDGRFVSFGEMQSDYLFKSFLPEALKWRQSMFPGFFFYDFCDPAGLSKNPTDEKSCFDLMLEAGLTPVAGAQTLVARLGSVSALLSTLKRGKAEYQLCEQGCPMLLQGFRGAYCYEETRGMEDTQYKEKPAKTRSADLHDALQYPATMLDTVRIKTAGEGKPLSKKWRFR